MLLKRGWEPRRGIWKGGQVWRKIDFGGMGVRLGFWEAKQKRQWVGLRGGFN